MKGTNTLNTIILTGEQTAVYNLVYYWAFMAEVYWVFPHKGAHYDQSFAWSSTQIWDWLCFLGFERIRSTRVEKRELKCCRNCAAKAKKKIGEIAKKMAEVAVV